MDVSVKLMERKKILFKGRGIEELKKVDDLLK